MRFPLSRTPIPRAVRLRLESGRVVVLSVLLGGVVGALCILLRLLLDLLRPVGAWLSSYAPPGTPGEGGLLMAFGHVSPLLLLVLPLAGAAYTWLVPAVPGGAFAQLVRGAHHSQRGEGWPDPRTQARTLLGTLLAYVSGLLVGRDSLFVLLGQLGTRVLGSLTRLDAGELRMLMLAGAAAGLGAVLHAPLAAAVLVAEVLYRRFEFEFEVLMPCVLAAVASYAVYGLAFGFAPLLRIPYGGQLPPLTQAPALAAVALVVTAAGWLLLHACRLLPASLTDGRWRPVLGAVFGLATAGIALLATPTVLGDGSGWMQVGLSGFMGADAGAQGLWRWLLLALGARLAFGGSVLPTVGIGGLLGVGLSQVLHTDPAVAGLIGAVAFLTVTLNVPLGATLLAVAWGGDTMLPLALLAAGLAHAISGEPGIIPGQLRSRADSALPAPASGLALPNTVRALPRRPVQTAGTPYLPDTGIDQNGRQLYRRPVPSNWRGAKLKLLALPPAVEVVGVLRGGAVQLPRPELRLTDGDELIFLAQPEAYASLENMLRLPGA
ncbi:chloride channel protein [Deinococcus radiodurans]|uniref:RCK C-terminal domain-containing protein n=1 Tax=Deinococcus radiodurans (strain ATCC 13939 / DSM 20539 / JCM 16871 / CCUG 27074 / LMG 4051 / NBRC 15346 / NCIMB 9279 / VKM B-1422 / R1) TaxID=243230 RepID=Q9RTK8_DEIRA|nr:chloride channel protein [Deinococcus radiodurans]AAF11316.1 hypothetical protein DR_1752 [Deinococcus radiodurans R1 = ATCC 13939 = DSM 20539]ANC71150.1 Cl- channel voltage-gated family protein [Deinococcus radiodurans R1 = ATCC 13939 = DSM 20539]QEM71174.1 Cl- channel voltage-gated family protein [Deinococcus radiodurans]QIP29720.1 Cl- channel voltage-gated family protein [Deinococcus radiodurans]UDL00828.1 Cl- channel voltage-gated family protein [Deinococcus radiodurans R1 = ATCC 13939 